MGVKVGSTVPVLVVQVEAEANHLAGHGIIAEDLGVGLGINRLAAGRRSEPLIWLILITTPGGAGGRPGVAVVVMFR